MENGPVAVRYPRGGEGSFQQDTFAQPVAQVRAGDQITLCAYGCMAQVALKAADKLSEAGISAAVIKINELTDGGMDLLMQSVRSTGRLLVLEDCVEAGCLGQHLAAKLLNNEILTKVKLCNLGNHFVQQGTVEQLYSACNIDVWSVFEAAKELVHG